MRKRFLCVVGALSVSDCGVCRGSAPLIPDDEDDDEADVGGDDEGGLSSRHILKRSLSRSCGRKPVKVSADVLSFVSRFSLTKSESRRQKEHLQRQPSPQQPRC